MKALKPHTAAFSSANQNTGRQVIQRSDVSFAARRSRPGGRSSDVLSRIYGATLEILSEKGLSGVSFNEVALAADVNRSTLYRRWADRNELVLDAIMASIHEQISPSRIGGIDRELSSVLKQIGDYLSSPLGRAVLVASVELTSGDTAAGQRQISLWRERVKEFDPIFERACERGEIAKDFDWESAFAMAAGSIYYRVIVHNRPVDRAWVQRTMAHWKRLAGLD